MTSSGYQTSGRYSVSTKSPQTGTILDANSGGSWGMRFKNAGYDALIVTGQSKTPVYLDVSPGACSSRMPATCGARRAANDRGAGREDAQRALHRPGRRESGALRRHHERQYRAPGARRPGAVMGSKRLKAIVISGDEKYALHDQELMRFIRYESGKMLKANPVTSQGFPEFGTAVLVNIMNTMGTLPTRNFQQSQFEEAEAISGETIADTILVKNTACWACPIACARYTKTDKVRAKARSTRRSGRWAPRAASPTWQPSPRPTTSATTWAWTPSRPAHHRLRHGTDGEGLPDSDLRFGRADLLAPTLDAMAYRRGLGDDLAEGSARLAAKYGAPELSMTRQGSGDAGLRPAWLAGPGPALRHLQPRRLPHARQHDRRRGAGPAQADRPLPVPG